MFSTKCSGTSPKQAVIHGFAGTTCQQTQFVVATYPYGGPTPQGIRPTIYSACGARSLETNLAGTSWVCGTCTPKLIQQPENSTSGYKCQYGVWGDGVGDGVGCFKMPSDKWVTIYVKIHIGTWGSSNSTVDAWVAVDGGPYKQWIKVPNYTVQNDYQSQDNNFSRIMLTTYMTGKNPTVSHPTAHAWYDELIVSTQPIAAPGNTSPDLTPPAPPTNFQSSP